MKNIRSRLIILSFLEFAVWGAYLTSMGSYLVSVNLAGNIGWFYAVQGIVSLFMPALVGIVADRWMSAQKVLSLCHFLAAIFMGSAAWYGYCESISSDSGFWNHRIYLLHAFHRLYRFSDYLFPVFCIGGHKCSSGSVCFNIT